MVRLLVPRAPRFSPLGHHLIRTSTLAHLPGGEEDAADTEGVEDDAEDAGPRKRKIRSGGSTLESNSENLNLKDLEYQITTDPLFQKTSASFDEGGAKGMLLNNLSVQNGCQIVFDSSDAIDDGSINREGSPDDDELELGDLAGELNDLLSSIGGAELTPGFTQFRLGHTKPQAAGNSLVIGASVVRHPYDFASVGLHARLAAYMPILCAEEMPSTFDDDDEAGGFVDDGADFDDDDDGAGATYDGGDEPAGDSAHMVDAFSGAPKVAGAEELLDFPLEMMAQGGGDGMRGDFRDSIFGANWAGPGGKWKHSKDKPDGATDKKGPKEKFVLDFSVQVPDSALECAKAATAFTLSATALENNTEESTTMPEDLHYQLKELCTLFTKPSVRVGQGQSAGDGGAGSAAGGEGWYDYGNENDMENFCPDLDAGGVDDDDDCGGLDDSLVDESGMIGAPQLVGDTKINYARAAKKVDVHLLKESIWDTIEDKQKPLSDATNKSKQGTGVVQGFQSIIGGVNDHVPADKKDMLKDVSVPFCFICLLHLANEKNLVLTDDKLGKLARLDIGPDGSEGEGTGSCDWATASKNFDKIAGKSGAVRAS